MLVRHTFPLDAEYEFSVTGGGGGGGGAAAAPPSTSPSTASKSTVANPRSFRMHGHRRPARHRRRGRRPAARRRRRRAVYSDFRIDCRVHAGGRRADASPSPARSTPPARRHAEPAADFRVPAGRAAEPRKRDRARAQDRHDAGAPRLPPARVVDDEVDTLMGFYQQGRKEGDFETGIQQALARVLVAPRFLFRAEEEPPSVAARRGLSHQRCRAGVAAVVLPVEQHSRRRAAGRGGQGPAARSEGARTAGQADAGRSQVGRADHELRRPVAVPARAGGRADRRRRTSTTTCARRSGARPRCSSAPSSARTGARST